MIGARSMDEKILLMRMAEKVRRQVKQLRAQFGLQTPAIRLTPS